ncbi:hypothetical protein PP459_gp131 [Streptomyces phage Wakanda]|uniref:Macro domain-containing protein n=1 Tax=Streptomyces phage Wakanda TaxID=2713267 RepID=A0A6G8R1N1_9CAUD|nr:hypothetical protein PP459_gp131 [Streptomyces phage Wakanda]QIN94102.1 hypothetical protein SEA_WAKANDA_135 [Streptomyces phage Wakanda]
MVTYVKGDATKPQGDGKKIIAHICNDSGRWGAGFVKAISQKSTEPELRYREWYRQTKERGDYFLPLGHVQFVSCSATITVANMVAQHGTYSAKYNPHPISYDALEYCLNKVALVAEAENSSVHMPRIGTGLARGNWEVIESVINRTLTLRDIDVTVYDL